MRGKAVSGIMLTLLFMGLLSLALNTTIVNSPVEHDVVILNVSPSDYSASKCWTISINVTVRNNGTEIETFNATVYYDDTAIETQTVTDMPSQSNLTLTFTWETSSVPCGTHLISANVSSPVLGEIRKDDGYVEIWLMCDVNGNCRLDLGDLGKIILIYSGILSCDWIWWWWCERADSNGNRIIDLGDLAKCILVYSGIITCT